MWTRIFVRGSAPERPYRGVVEGVLRPALVIVLAMLVQPVASGDEDDNRPTVRLEPLQTFEAGDGIVRSLAWTPDAKRLAAGCSDRTLRIWEPTAAAPVATVTLPRYG